MESSGLGIINILCRYSLGVPQEYGGETHSEQHVTQSKFEGNTCRTQDNNLPVCNHVHFSLQNMKLESIFATQLPDIEFIPLRF
jgi:hypothetical protein